LHANEATQYLEQHANLIDFVDAIDKVVVASGGWRNNNDVDEKQLHDIWL